VSLSIPLPLVNQNQGRIAETAAAGTRADARIEALKLSISNEVASVYAEAERLQQVIAEYQRNMLPVTERNVRLAQQGYNQGLVSIVEVVQAQRQQGELNGTYLNTLDQYLQAQMRLNTAAASYLKYINEPSQETP
jgi:cobalt-zinc-cadmium efflux system outer membrane protein